MRISRQLTINGDDPFKATGESDVWYGQKVRPCTIVAAVVRREGSVDNHLAATSVPQTYTHSCVAVGGERRGI